MIPFETRRILDANLNRAREAVRVMEDYARYALDDAALAETCKQVRHELAAAVPAELATELMLGRNIRGDVGAALTAHGEYQRADAADVVTAAGKRLSEALRVLEEFAKTLDEALARGLEQLRYRAYDIERRLYVLLRARQRMGTARLYVLITEALCSGNWFDTAEQVLAAGIDVLQLREKALPDRELLARARRLAKLCHEHGTILILNDRPDLAVAAGAGGVHLGQDDLAAVDARRILRPGMVVGCSTHTRAQLADAIAAAPDYVAVGPMFPSATKPQDHVPGPALLAEAASLTGLPLVAIGGIDHVNAQDVVRAAPQCCLCVCSAVIADSDPGSAVVRIRAAVEAARGA